MRITVLTVLSLGLGIIPLPAQVFPAKPVPTPGGPVISGQPVLPNKPSLSTESPSTNGDPNANGLKEVPYAKLSEPTSNRLGQAALSIRPTEWKHAETANFIYHYFNRFVANPVSVEAEFYYRVIAKDLGKDTSSWERKCHIYIFEGKADWAAFQKVGGLDPWTGGLHSQNELFINRDPSFKWQGDTLGHETAHLVVDRFYGTTNIPLWLNEGYAEYIGSVGYAAFYRARGFTAKPRSIPVAPKDFMPLATLVGLTSYPPEPQVSTYYNESEKLVRYLTSLDGNKFNVFLEQMGKGRRLENALSSAYGSSLTMAKLQADFTLYATKDYNSQNIRAQGNAN